jgi:hypothetical protein
MTRRPRERLVSIALVLGLAVPLPAAAADKPAPKAAIAAAVEHAIFHYADPQKLRLGASVRSRVDRRWSLVTGGYGRRGLWAAWVRRAPSGRYRVRIFRTRNFDPGREPPCDIRPAFAEPEC